MVRWSSWSTCRERSRSGTRATRITFPSVFGCWTRTLAMLRFATLNQRPTCTSKCPCTWTTTGRSICRICTSGPPCSRTCSGWSRWWSSPSESIHRCTRNRSNPRNRQRHIRRVSILTELQITSFDFTKVWEELQRYNLLPFNDSELRFE